MKKDFDFEEIGKKLPYRTPEGFFEEMQKQVMDRTRPSGKRRTFLLQLTPVILATAAVLSAIAFLPGNYQQYSNTENNSLAVTDNAKWIEDMSDEDLEVMDEITSCDIFIN